MKPFVFVLAACSMFSGNPAPQAVPAPAPDAAEGWLGANRDVVARMQKAVSAFDDATPVVPAAEVCLDDATAALARRLEVESGWTSDPLFGPTMLRQARYGIATHSPTSLLDGLRRYTPGTAALVTYSGDDGGCSWLVDGSGVVAYGRHPRSRADIRALATGLRQGLGVLVPTRSPTPRAEAVPAEPAPVGGFGDVAAILDELSEVLMPGPVRKAARQRQSLVIAPDAPWLDVPFALVPVHERDGEPVPLVEVVALSVAPAVGEIGIGRGLHRGHDLGSLTLDERKALLARSVVVGNPSFADAEYAMPPLPGAETEARAVAAILGTEPLIGATATEDAVFAKLNRRGEPPRYWHLATHGLADVEAVKDNRSFLALANGDRLEDADFGGGTGVSRDAVIVLSACQTGLGVRRPGGMVGLPRLFQRRGAQTVVMSLWNVDDEATADLMTGFTTNLVATGRPALALAQAMRSTRSRYPEPAKWASFSVFGTGQLH